MGGFCLLLELHREGSAPAACVAGLFNKALMFLHRKRLWWDIQERRTLDPGMKYSTVQYSTVQYSTVYHSERWNIEI